MSDSTTGEDQGRGDVQTAADEATESASQQTLADLMATDARVGWPLTPHDINVNMHGWFRPGNVETLSHLIQPEHKCIIELGSWLGVSTVKLLQLAPKALLFAVDIWSNEYFLSDSHYDKNNETFRNILEGPPIYHQFLANTKKYQVRKITENEDATDGKEHVKYEGLVPMKIPSTEALPKLKNLQIEPDLIYIDASHHYEFVVQDVTMCLELFPNAMLVGDDWDNMDVRRAVQHVAHRHNKSIYVNGGTCWTFEKEKMEQFARKKRERDEEEAGQYKRQKLLGQSSFKDILGMYKKK
jgi:hypothetical protein